MEILTTLLTNGAYIEGPDTLVEIVGVLLLGGLIGWGAYWWREKDMRWTRREWGLLVGLIVLTFISSLFLGVRLPAEGALPRPLLPDEPPGPVLMFFAAIPWVFAAGLLGPVAAVGVAALSGFLLGLFETRSLFTMIQVAALALVFSAAIRQRYRTLLYRILRHPIVAAVVLGLLYIPLFLVVTILETSGPIVTRVDYGLTRLNMSTLAIWGELLVAGLAAEAFASLLAKHWGRREAVKPSPAETSIQLRFFFGTAPLVLLLLFTLMVGDWLVAGQAARTMLEARLSNTAQIAAESFPYFLEAGQNLIQQMASNPRLAAAPSEQVSDILARDLRSVPYFRQLYFLDENGQPVSGYPEKEYARIFPTEEEEVGIQLALQGVTIQTYTVPPGRGERTAQVSYLASVLDQDGAVLGVLLGRSDLATNPFTKPIIQAMESMKDDTGGISGSGIYGTIIDEKGKILYHPTASRLMTNYLGKTSDVSSFYDETGPEGTRNLVFYQPTAGRTWAVVLTVPAQRAQQLALTIALPMLFIILVITIVALVALRLGLRVVTASLQTLAGESVRISQGQLDHALVVKGVDEVGRLSQAFEHMRASLKARLEELNRLLVVSQGVASSLEMRDATRPILEAALSSGASAARVALEPDPNLATQADMPTHFGIGSSSDLYASLDEQILNLTRNHDKVVLSNLSRGRGLNFAVGSPHPSSLMAVALHHENRYYGCLWVAYDISRTFSDEEVRFLSTLAGEAALAAANARLYATAEVGRQRLEAILASTPDPVLVTDHHGHLLLNNPAALQLPGFNGNTNGGQPIDAVIQQADLLGLLRSDAEEEPSREISFTNGKVYYATVSSVVVDEKPVGKVCILRDITHYKELDALKSDFVATVSHDLRSPLTLMRGYATMLQMVGDLNDQQKGYVRKIISGVESMSRLVNNLLDLGRIEAGVGLQLEMVAVSEIVERVTSSLQLQAAQKNIQLSQELPAEGSPLIQADPALLQQALYNLVENAIKYTPVGGQVHVRAQSRPLGVLFDVRDSGIGIAPLDQPRLFEKFYRGGQRETYQQRGSGLGLAIVKSIAERHGGRVWVESYLGKGSTFFLEIPFEHEKVEKPAN